MKYIPLLFSVIFLGSIGYVIDADAILGCDSPAHCYALEQFNQYHITGI